MRVGDEKQRIILLWPLGKKTIFNLSFSLDEVLDVWITEYLSFFLSFFLSPGGSLQSSMVQKRTLPIVQYL